jgi:two-component system, LytTR family, sensor kinase
MLNDHQPLIVNAAFHLAGAIAFGIFLTLALRGATHRRLRENWLAIGAAGLAWIWNVGSFFVLLLHPGGLRWGVEAIGFSALSLLPAVLLQFSLTGKMRAVAVAGYAVAAVAISMHLLEDVWPGADLHRRGLFVITAGFASLTAISVAGILLEGGRGTRGRMSRTLASMCLMLFAITFSHLSAEPADAWSKELLLHHAGIPLALLILLQDYRFVFLDAFIRFLANVILAAVMAFAGVRLALRLMPANGFAHPLAETLTGASLCVVMIAFAYLRGFVQQWLTTAVFRRSDVSAAAHGLRQNAPGFHNDEEYVRWAAARIAAWTGAPSFEIVEQRRIPEGAGSLDYPSIAAEVPWLRVDARWNWVEVAAPVRLSLSDVRILLLGSRRGGRRYLSEELRALNHLVTIAAEETERFRTAEMQRLVSEAELLALQSQINPHFLFNALNTLYGIIPREASGARRTVLNLADIFRYFLQSGKSLIPLSEEIKIVTAYLDIERLRLGPRLQTEIRIDEDCRDALIPILSIQPLVENSIKHGLSNRDGEGWLRVTASASGGNVTIAVEDSGAGALTEAVRAASKGAGVGLTNVTRRLQLCFGPAAGVSMRQSDFGTHVQFSVPLSQMARDQYEVEGGRLRP